MSRIKNIFRRLFFWRGFSRRNKTATAVGLIILGVFSSLYIWNAINPEGTKAAWFNDDWAHRVAINISAHTSAEANVYINLTGSDDLDTSDTTKFQTDCGDLRFTNAAGEILPYYIVSGCGSASTVIHVNLKSFPAGAQTIYYYYGNPTVANGFSASDFAKAATGVTFGTVGTEETTPGVVAYWRFDEGTGNVATSSASTKIQASLFSMSTPATASSGWQTEDKCINSKCIAFDGTDDYSILGNDSSLNFAANAAFTISGWVRTSDAYGAIVSFRSSSSTNPVLDIAVGANGSTDVPGKLMALVRDDGSSNAFSEITGGTVNDSKWHHFALTRSTSSGTITLYLDGKSQGTDSGSDSDGALTTTLRGLGSERIWVRDGEETADKRFLRGTLDDIKVYKYEMSTEQIKSNYNSRGSSDIGSAVLGASTENIPGSLSNGLVGYWKMNEASWSNNCSATIVLDSSGNGLNGKACPASTGPTGGAAGKFGNAGQFDGGGDYVEVADNDTIEVGTGDFTLSAWVYNTETSESFVTAVMVKGFNSTADYGFAVQYSSGNYYVMDSAGSRFFTGASGTEGKFNQWQHLVMVRKGGTASIYADGVFAGSTSFTSGSSNNVFAIGSWGGQLNNFDGKIDEARVYNRALSVAEIQSLYKWAPGPVGYWDFEEGSGTSARDTSGNGFVGTIAGSPSWGQGKVGKAILYDGIDDNVDVGDISYLNSVSQFTLGAWMKKNATTDKVAITKGDGVGSIDARAIDYWSDGKLYFEAAGGSAAAYGAYALNDTNWHYFVMVYDGTQTGNANRLKGYVDGRQVTLDFEGTTIPATVSSGGEPLEFGDYGAFKTTGRIDQIRLYNYPRTAAQVVSDMNAGHPNVGSPVGSALGHWKFDEGKGTVAGNSGSAGNASNGTITSATWSQNGKFGRALDFIQGGSNRVQLPVTIPTTDFTYSSWVKGTVGGNYRQIWQVEGATSGDNDDMALIYTFDAQTVDFVIDASIVLTSTALPTNKWNHILVTRTGSTVNMYINGQLNDTATNSTAFTIDSACNYLWIGVDVTDCGGGSYAGAFGGSIDEVKVYNYGLTASQVLLEYNRGSGQVLGSLSDTSQLTGGSVASNSASAEYCVPGSSESCAAPVLRWDLEEGTGTSAQDTSGNGRTGTISGSPPWTIGKIGKSLQFSQSSNADDVRHSSLLGSPTNITLEAWVNFTDKDTSGGQIISIGDHVGLIADSGACTGPEGYYYNGTTWHSSCYTTTIEDKGWYHLAYVVNDTANTQILYVNGIEADTDTNVASIGWSGLQSVTTLGEHSDTGDLNWSYGGKIDQVRVYGYARSAEQIAWDYTRGAPIAHWKIDECQGTRINDSSGKSNTGTWSGSGGGNTTAGTCNTPTDGTAAWYDGRVGKYNFSLDFDGTDDVVRATETTSTDLGATTDSYSVSGWIKTSTNFSGNAYIVAKDDSGSAPYPFRLYLNSSEQACFDILQLTNNPTICGSTALNDGNWHHIIGIRDVTNDVLRLYVDGKTAATAVADSTGSSVNDDDVSIGNGGTSYTSQDFTGQIDDVRIYNYAATASQIKMIMNQAAGIRFGPVTGTP